jgi:hypothetical protein
MAMHDGGVTPAAMVVVTAATSSALRVRAAKVSEYCYKPLGIYSQMPGPVRS